jgi:kinesin family protein 20
VLPPASSIYAKNKQLKATVFQFSQVFNLQQEMSQAKFFASTIQPCLQKFLAGDNLLIFNFGLTNSDKVYTMKGTDTRPGLIPRTLDYLFESIRQGRASDQDGVSTGLFFFKP